MRIARQIARQSFPSAVLKWRKVLRIRIYSLRHRKCGVRGFIHELFVSKPERARYERVRVFDTNNE